MMEQLETGNTSTAAIFNDCFGFIKIDAGAIVRIKNAAFGVGV